MLYDFCLRMHGILAALLFEQRNMQASGFGEFKRNASGLIEKVGEVGRVGWVVRGGGWGDGIIGGKQGTSGGSLLWFA